MGFLASAGVLGAVLLFFLSPQFPWYWIWLTPLLAFLPRPALWPLLYVSCAALLQYAKWFDDWRWFGMNPFLGRDLVQFVPAALLAGALYFRSRRTCLTNPFSPLVRPALRSWKPLRVNTPLPTSTRRRGNNSGRSSSH